MNREPHTVFPDFFSSKPVTIVKITTESSPMIIGINTKERDLNIVLNIDDNEASIIPTTGLEFKEAWIPGKCTKTR
jgi:hypothetical protein